MSKKQETPPSSKKQTKTPVGKKKAKPPTAIKQVKSSVKKLENDFIILQVNEKPSCRIEFNVKAKPPLIKKVQKKAIKQVNKQVSVPGFRPGKAPEETILKNYSSHVEERLKKIIADDSFKEAVLLAKIPILRDSSSITYDVKSIEGEKEVIIFFSFETEPTLPSIHPSKYKKSIQIKQKSVSKKEIDEAIRQTQFFYAKWDEITGRGVKEGDFILIDLDTAKEPIQNVFKDTRFEVKSEKMSEWMKKLVIGMKPNETKVGISKPDKDASAKEKKGFEEKKVKITLKKIEKAHLPELNEEFAKKVGAKDLKHFQQSIEDTLKKKLEEKFDKEIREDINQFLLKTYSFDLPLSLIEKEKKYRIDQILASNKQYSTLSAEEKNDLDKKINLEAENAVRLFYLSRKVLDDAKLEITHQDVQNEIVMTMQAYGPVHIDPNSIPKETYALAFSKVMLKKAQDYILENSKKQT